MHELINYQSIINQSSILQSHSHCACEHVLTLCVAYCCMRMPVPYPVDRSLGSRESNWIKNIAVVTHVVKMNGGHTNTGRWALGEGLSPSTRAAELVQNGLVLSTRLVLGMTTHLPVV